MTLDADHLTAYALGTLSPEQQAEVEKALERDPEARREVRAMQDALTDMVLELEPVALRPDAEQSLLARVRGQTSSVQAHTSVLEVSRPQVQSQQQHRWVLGAALAGIAAVIALAVVIPNLPAVQEQRIQSEFREYSSRPGAVAQPLLDARGESAGRLVRLATGEVFVLLDKAPVNARVYQAWRIEKGQNPVSLGVYSNRNFLTSRAVPNGETFAISLEPPGGSDQPSSAPIAVAQL